jgi:hypothetical protein
MIVLLLAASLLADDAPVGLVSLVKGSVQLQHAGQKTSVPAKMADLVAPGDHLITGTGGEAAFLFCPESRAARLPPEGEVVFTASALEVAKGKLADDHKIAGCRLPASLNLSAASQQQAGLVKSRGVEWGLRAPIEGVSVADARPRFTWEPEKQAVSYEVRVLDRNEQVLYKGKVTKPAFSYPAGAPALEAGAKYWWRVTAVGTEGPMDMKGSFFTTMPAVQAAQFHTSEEDLKKQAAANPKDTAPRILLAFLYEENGMYDAAAQAYDKLSSELPNNDWIKSRLIAMRAKLHWE